ncbi:hypothetical protein [Gordonia amicalis]|uniref:Transposase n=1 Tax=Gordonia amicalis TaxID=89053 RepID=A0ABU4DKH7_9ACTN|nr:hypothetical protein [Gordonia amicalis]MDV6309911.1 hypothetical protein [Gordonia amicalis]
MRIAHPRRGYTGVEIHQARRLEFVDGVAETDDSVALAAALSVKGYRQVVDDDWMTAANNESAEALAKLKESSKRKRAKPAHSVEDDVEFTPEHEPTIDD